MVWRGEMWGGLLQWWQDDPALQRALITRRAAQRRVRSLLARDGLPDLSLHRFKQDVCSFGHLAYADGQVLDDLRLAELDSDALGRMLERSEIVVSGNQCVESQMRVHPAVLPGLEEVRIDELRAYLEDLLYVRRDPAPVVDAAASHDGPLAAECISMILCFCRPGFGIWTPKRVGGLTRLAALTGLRCGPEVTHGTYSEFNSILVRLRDASNGVLADMLAVDGLLCRLAELRPPRAWKIAIGLTVPEAEANAIARRCLRQNFATIAPSSDDSPAIARLRSLQPGDCVVMHLRGRIGGIGRVTRPYYELDRTKAGPLDRRWWRRLGVEWIAGDRDYGALLSGAQQRFSVVELSWETFQATAAMYRQSSDYDRLFAGVRGAWVVCCDDERWETLRALNKPLPLRDRWVLRLEGDVPEPGARVFLRREGDDGGVCGVARVISEPGRIPRDATGAVRIDLLYERLYPEPLGADCLAGDPRTRDRRPPRTTEMARLSPEEAAAHAQAIDLPDERHFLLLADGREDLTLRPPTTYRYSPNAAGQPAQLTDAIAHGVARCLVYHGSPEHTFIGFGTVLEAAGREATLEAEAPVEIRLDLCRFMRRPWVGTGPSSSLPAPRLRRELGRTRTVLPISAHDFYRVVRRRDGRHRRA